MLLDEISEITPQLQAKLLRVIEERKLRRIGARTEQDVDVRVLAATNRDPTQAVVQGHLRADLLLSLEDSGSRMSRIGSGLLLFGTVLTTEDLLGRIEAVTAEQVRAVASQVLTGPRTLAVVGPFKESDFA